MVDIEAVPLFFCYILYPTVISTICRLSVTTRWQALLHMRITLQSSKSSWRGPHALVNRFCGFRATQPCTDTTTRWLNSIKYVNNLQCASAIFVLDIPPNFYTLVQVMGRLERIGQRGDTEMFVLWLNHTYDQVAPHRIYKKAVPSLAGEGIAAQSKDPNTTAAMQFSYFLGMHPSLNPNNKLWGSRNLEG